MPPDLPPDPARQVAHVTCTACGCLCDDITVTVQGNRITAAERACSMGKFWLLREDDNDGHPAATIDGQAVSLDQALDRAAAILGAARSPLIWGLNHSSIEAVGVALGLADRIGAAVDRYGSARRSSRRASFVREGEVSATLGEVKDRAEVVLFWGRHPDHSVPRHAERYSVQPAGRFLNGPRMVICVDVGPVFPEKPADLRLKLSPDQQDAALVVLRALASEVRLDPIRVERATGHPLAVWDDLLARLQSARYAAIFFARQADRLRPDGWDAAFGLVRALNRDGRRCVGLSLGESSNAAGAGAVCTWQAGAPDSLSFAAGFPEHFPGEATLLDRLERGEADALLAVGPSPAGNFPRLRDLQLIPSASVWIGPGATEPDPQWTPAVAIATGRLGIETGGTVERVDGVMLPLRPPLAGTRPADGAILQAIVARLIDPPS